MSFRTKTILGIAIIESALLLILTISALNYLGQSNLDQLHQRAQLTTQLLAQAAKESLIATDIATLKSITDEVIKHSDVTYIDIRNSHQSLAQAGQIPSDNESETSGLPSKVLHTRVDIVEGGLIFGTIKLGFSTISIDTLVTDAKRHIVAIAALEIVLVALFSYLLGTYLTRQLKQLQHATDTISREGPGHQLKIHGNDELAAVGRSFNAMSASLKNSYDELHASLAQEKDTLAMAQRAQDKNDAILNASLDAMIIIDQHGLVVDYNQVAKQTFGWSIDEIKGQVLGDYIVPPSLRDAHNQGMAHYRQTGEGPVLGQRLELHAVRKNGEQFPIEIAISPIKTDGTTLFTAFIRDISRRHIADTELRIAAHAFESTEAIIITDPEGHIIRVNKAFSRITGYTPDEVLGKKPRSLSSGLYDDSFYQDMWSQLADQGSWTGEIFNKRKNGEIFPEHLNINAVIDSNNNITHYVAHFVDISEQKNYESALVQARRDAEQASEAKSRFLAAMSHEIRTPMNGVLGVLGLLRDTSLNDMQRKMVKTARDSGEHLLTIINDILDFSKMEANKLSLETSDFSIEKIIKQAHELLLPQAKKKQLDLHYCIDDEVPSRINGDPDRLRQILINLINNAIKFTTSGHIAIRVSLDTMHDQHADIRFEVEDTGIGISSDDQISLFEEFTMADQSLSRSEQGTGLGLAICKRLIQLMQGYISVRSEPGMGSTFFFIVPLQLATTDHPDVDTDQQQAWLPTPGLRVLLAEDNSANQYVFKSILDKAQLVVDIAANGEEAVEACRLRPYDIVLMDISMPIMDGIEATKAIRELNDTIYTLPIVALTAHALDGDRERFLEAGMNDYLTKPLTGPILLNCIARWTHPTLQPSVDIAPSTTPDDSEESSPLNVIDPSVLEQLARDTSRELIPKLTRLFIEDSKQRLQTLQQALQQSDLTTLEFQTHTLGSSAASHGLPKLCQQCRDIEHLCRSGEHQQALQMAAKLADIANDAFQQLQRFVEQTFEDAKPARASGSDYD